MASEGPAFDASEHADEVALSLTYHGGTQVLSFPQDATVSDLSAEVSSTLEIPSSNQKFLVGGGIGLLKPPFKNPDMRVQELVGKKITLMGSTARQVDSLNKSISQATRPRGPPVLKAAQPARHRDWKRTTEEAQYTFHTLRPLPYLPNPDRSLRFLERLRDDAGIKAAMRAHKFSVPLLTEMDPAEHTTHESRTLGLNRNGGEVIELRLRTDAYDGYRDYKTIRKTLCHELAHNVWGPHDRNFWNLCHQIEKEVERDDWTRGGRTVGFEEYYTPSSEDDVHDHGGWTGGEFVLGGSAGGQNVVSSAGGNVPAGNLSRRDILARAAEERMKRQKQTEQNNTDSGGEPAS